MRTAMWVDATLAAVGTHRLLAAHSARGPWPRASKRSCVATPLAELRCRGRRPHSHARAQAVKKTGGACSACLGDDVAQPLLEARSDCARIGAAMFGARADGVVASEGVDGDSRASCGRAGSTRLRRRRGLRIPRTSGRPVLGKTCCFRRCHRQSQRAECSSPHRRSGCADAFHWVRALAFLRER